MDKNCFKQKRNSYVSSKDSWPVYFACHNDLVMIGMKHQDQIHFPLFSLGLHKTPVIYQKMSFKARLPEEHLRQVLHSFKGLHHAFLGHGVFSTC